MFWKKRSQKSSTAPFWETKKLKEMTQEEWESLCDRCGKCCLMKIGLFRVRFTNVGCPLLDVKTGQCKDYPNRWDTVPECLKLEAHNLKKYAKWLPQTCSYLWVLKKKRLPPWHPFISGKKNTIHTMGISVQNRAVEGKSPLPDLREHVVQWPDL